MNKMKLAQAVITAGTMMSGAAFAQSGGDPMRMIFQNVGASGAYINCNTSPCSYDVPTVIRSMMVTQLQQTTEETRKRYEELLEKTKTDLNDLVKVTFQSDSQGRPSLVQLSNTSVGANKTTGVDMQDIYQAYANYQSQYLTVENDFTIMASFFDGDDMSVPLQDQSVIKSFPTKTGATINPLVKTFWNNLRNLNKFVCHIKMIINYPNNTQGFGTDGRGVQPMTCDNDNSGAQEDPSKTQIPALSIHWEGQQFSKDEIARLREQLRQHRSTPQEVKDSVQKLGEMTRDTIISFIRIFGIEQKTSARTWSLTHWNPWGGSKNSGNGMSNANNVRIEAEDQNYKTLIEYFWARSALRFTTGLPIGAFAINYKHESNNSDVFNFQMEALSQIPKNMIFAQQGDAGFNKLSPQAQDSIKSARSAMTDEEVAQDKKNVTTLLQEASLKYLYALNTTNSRATLISGLDHTGGANALQLEGNYVSVINLANSIRGLMQKGGNQIEVAKVTNLVLQLMAADLFEEQVIRQPGGAKKMMALYKARYVKVSKEKRAIYSDLAKTYRNAVEGISSDAADPTGDTNYQDETDIKSMTTTVAQNLRNWLSNISQSRIYQVQLDFAMGAGSSKEIRRSDARQKDL